MRSAFLGAAAALVFGAGLLLLPGKPPPPQQRPGDVTFRPGVAAHVPIGDIAPGGEITLTGALRTTFDNTVLDGATRTDFAQGTPNTRPLGYFEIERAGLRVVSTDPITHTARLAASGGEAPACEAAGLPGPCLVARTRDLAKERMISEGEFARSLQGEIKAQVPRAPVLVPPPETPALAYGLFAASGVLLGAAGATFMRRRQTSLLGRVREQADRARRATSKDPSLAEIRKRIEELVIRAEDLDAARVACEARSAKIDRKALLEKRRVLESKGAETSDVLAWVGREIAEAEKVEKDAVLAVAGIERIISALHVIALEAREERGVRVRAKVDDPVDLVRVELERREEARIETEEEIEPPKEKAKTA